MLSKDLHRNIFLVGTAGLIVGLPLWPILLSLSQLLLSLNWLVELNYKEKLRTIWYRKSIVLLASIYIVHLIGLMNTTHFNYALNDLKIKLPLFALPVIYGTSEPLSGKELKSMLKLFIGAVLISSIISTVVISGITKIILVDSRHASIIIHHIRFSLLLVLAIYLLFYFLFFKYHSLLKWEKIAFVLSCLWLIFFLFLLNAFTGIVIFLILLPVAILWWAFHTKSAFIVRISFATTLFLLTTIVLYSMHSYHRFNIRYQTEANTLQSFTKNGNKYSHLINDSNYENGHQIWIYLCEKELKKEWDNTSKFKYDSLDRKGQPIRTTIIRYLTSLGYNKDSVGVSKLTSKDIDMIERGYTNYLYKNKFAVYPRLYELFWQLEMFKKTNNPSGQSLAQRIVYFRTGIKIIHRHFWLGAGTGDLQDIFDKQYDIDKSPLPTTLRLRAHNQFLTFFIAFGVFGFSWICFALFYAPYLEKKYSYFLFTIFLLIGILSMLDDDTLETQAGVTIFAFFYSFLLYLSSDKEILDDLQTR